MGAESLLVVHPVTSDFMTGKYACTVSWQSALHAHIACRLITDLK